MVQLYNNPYHTRIRISGIVRERNVRVFRDSWCIRDHCDNPHIASVFFRERFLICGILVWYIAKHAYVTEQRGGEFSGFSLCVMLYIRIDDLPAEEWSGAILKRLLIIRLFWVCTATL